MTKLFASFAKDESGATAIEYALLASLVAIAIIAAATGLGSKIKGSLGNAANAMK
jgi:pilus assembly protein Flp/PilA